MSVTFPKVSGDQDVDDNPSYAAFIAPDWLLPHVGLRCGRPPHPGRIRGRGRGENEAPLLWRGFLISGYDRNRQVISTSERNTVSFHKKVECGQCLTGHVSST